MTDRTDYTQGLRALADILDAHPEVPLPFHGRANGAPITIHHLGSGPEQREAFLASVRAFPGLRKKQVWDDYYDVEVALHGLAVKVSTYRDTVCERVVTGTTVVTREVRDPEALAKVPTTTITETVEQVEWVCTPLLAEAESVSA